MIASGTAQNEQQIAPGSETSGRTVTHIELSWITHTAEFEPKGGKLLLDYPGRLPTPMALGEWIMSQLIERYPIFKGWHTNGCEAWWGSFCDPDKYASYKVYDSCFVSKVDEGIEDTAVVCIDVFQYDEELIL